MSIYKKEVKEGVRALVTPILAQKGMVLVDIVFQPRKGTSLLRVYIDKEGGVDVEDCATVSRMLGDLLDVHGELIFGRYLLEVSSPGLNRPLVTREDFLRYQGQEASIRLLRPVAGRRNFKGIISGLEGDTLILEAEGGPFRLPLNDLDRANLIYKFQ